MRVEDVGRLYKVCVGFTSGEDESVFVKRLVLSSESSREKYEFDLRQWLSATREPLWALQTDIAASGDRVKGLRSDQYSITINTSDEKGQNLNLNLKHSRACRSGLEKSRGQQHEFGVGKNNGQFLRKLNKSLTIAKNGQKFDF